jgi:hypothetical protein
MDVFGVALKIHGRDTKYIKKSIQINLRQDTRFENTRFDDRAILKYSLIVM